MSREKAKKEVYRIIRRAAKKGASVHTRTYTEKLASYYGMPKQVIAGQIRAAVHDFAICKLKYEYLNSSLY